MTPLKLLLVATVTLALLTGGASSPGSPMETPFSHLPQIQQTASQSVDPLEIKRLIDEGKRTWKKSGVVKNIDFGPTWEKLGIDARFLQGCGGGSCEAEIAKADLDGEFPEEVILKINDIHFCRFLVFTPRSASGRASWTFRGYIDWDFNKYEMARHRIVRANGRPWLAVRAQAGSGSGFSLYHETLYELTSGGLQQVLSYPIQGQTYPWPTGLARSFRASVKPGANGELVVLYTVDYEALQYADKKFSTLAVNRHRVCYTWNHEKRAFGFSPACSDTSEQEISAIANIETGEEDEGEQIGATKFYSMSQQKAFVGGGYDVFVKYNFPVLMKIAKSNSETEREWLRYFLRDCEDTPKKAELLKALAQK